MATFDPLPTFRKELSASEYQSIRNKLHQLYNEASKLHSDFTQMVQIDTAIRDEVFTDFTKGLDSLGSIAKKRNISLRVIAQIFADKILQEGINYFKLVNYSINHKRILSQFDINRPLLLDLGIFLRSVQEPTAVFICSVNGLCLSVSQLVIALAFLNVYLQNPEVSQILKKAFDEIEASMDTYWVNPELIACSLLAEEGEEEFQIELERDLGFTGPYKNDQHEIVNRVRETDLSLQKMYNFDMPVKEFLLQPSSLKVDAINNGIRELENHRIHHYYELASGEKLCQMLFSDIQGNMEVYVNRLQNGQTNYAYGKIIKVLSSHLFEIKPQSSDWGDSAKLYQVHRRDIAYGKECKNIDYPVGTRVLAFFQPRNRTESKLFKGSWMLGTVGRGANGDVNQEYLIFFDCDQDAYISRKFVRLHFDQAVEYDKNGVPISVVPNENYTKCVRRKEFLRSYLYCGRGPILHTNRIGTTIAAINERKVYQATILDIDRELFLLRYNKTDIHNGTESGRGCSDVRCYQHSHFDEYVYRGSTTKLNPPDEKRTKRRNRFGGAVDSTSVISNDTSKLPTARKSTTSNKAEYYTRSSSMFDDEDGTSLKDRKEKAKKYLTTHMNTPEWNYKTVNHNEHGPECLSRYKSQIEKGSEGFPKVVSPYFRPLLNGWTRKVITYAGDYSKRKRTKSYVIYKAPCGSQFYNHDQITIYLKNTQSSIPIFYFDFSPTLRPETICKEFYPNSVIDPDFAIGMEDVPIPVVNAVDKASKPTMVYNIKRYAKNERIDTMLSEISSKAICKCECTDNCSDPTTCACQQLTFIEHARLNEQLQAPHSLYQFGRVEFRVQSGIYECNSYCHCNKNVCHNYVAQRKVVIPLQLFQTPLSGWGVRTLVDIPKGAFISTYSGELLDNTLADKMKHSDVYFAETDLIEDFENMKIDKGLDIPDEGVEVDMPESTPKEGIQLTRYFEDDLTFIVDAYYEGNIGRFYNHSCEPNMFINNVFTDTHDLRLPCLAFFAACEIKAGTELTWDYGYTSYDRGIKCHCNATNCRGFLM